MKFNFNLNFILILMLVNIWQIGCLQAADRDRNMARIHDTLAAQKKRTMRVCNSICRLSHSSDTQNNHLLVFGILSSNIKLVELALNRDIAGATVASIERFETIYTGSTVVDGVAIEQMNFERPFARSFVTMPFLATYMASARPTIASHAISSVVRTLCWRDAARRARK
jgi:hypothetical protein